TIKDTLQFLLQPSSEKYHLVLMKGDGSTATFINTLQQRRYTNFSKQVNQGNYLIITNPLLYGTSPNNYIQQYSDYRSSDSGGNFNAKVVDIHDLEDQFAYGISMHPLAVKNFLRFARTNFTTAPAYAFLIGKGISYTAYRYAETNPLTAQLNLIPVFGSPGSDNLLSAENYSDIPETPIGRLSAVTPAEVGAYLDKIKQYETAQRDTTNTIQEKLWMKKVLHLAGANDGSIGHLVDSFQTKYTRIISDTLLGADVSTFSKTADPSGYTQALSDFTNEYSHGSALLEYLGHSSSSSIDFNLDNPANYNNEGKYPVFIINGCLAGNIFDYDQNRLNNRSTLAEKFILEPQRGAIGYLSSSSYAVLSYINIFTQQFYVSMTSKEYGNGFGNIIKDGITNVLNYTGPTDFYARMHAEQFTFSGDPALKMNASPLPDFAIDSSQILIGPGHLTVSSDSFTVKIKVHNLGKATNDSVNFYLSRKFPNGNTDTAFYGKINAVKNTDSIVIKLPVVVNRDRGTTVITATIDDKNFIPEVTEKNNTASVSIKISAADPLPVFPYNYSIANTNTIDLSVSAAFDSVTQFIVEVDTTALFNSPVKISRQQISRGGLITFPNISLSLNNTVYYWRVSKDSADKHWNGFSFTYREGGNTGFEQAHFYQHTQSAFNGVGLDSSTRAFNFSPAYDNLFIQHSIYPTSGLQDAQFSVALNGSIITWSACVGSSVIFNIFDPKTLKPVLDSTLPYNAGYICDAKHRFNFEYSTQSAAGRKNAMDFLDNYVQNGYYVVVRKIYDIGNADWAPTVWAKDTALYGHNNSLYHRLKDQGVAVDSFTYPRTFIFIFKKNDSAHYEPLSVLSKGLYDRITTSQNISVFDTAGTVTSPVFGPGKSWSKVKWYGAAENNNNVATLDVITIDKNGKDSVWVTIDTSQHELNISTINAADYPYVKLRMHTKDAVAAKPYQLRNWGVEFVPAPEGVIVANLGIDIPESLT
ncbi:MAG TPA: C25 family cysteine peptidase, partial [Chitinophagaceae bacterium]|nr:C25 family cysteine peptidase [Chitinophagaceae bacterium]